MQVFFLYYFRSILLFINTLIASAYIELTLFIQSPLLQMRSMIIVFFRITIPNLPPLSVADFIGTLSEHYRNINESVTWSQPADLNCPKHVSPLLISYQSHKKKTA